MFLGRLVVGWSLSESNCYPAREHNALWRLSAASPFATISLACWWIMNVWEPFFRGDKVHAYIDFSLSCLARYPVFVNFLEFLSSLFKLCWALFQILKLYKNSKVKSEEVFWFLSLPNGTIQAFFIRQMKESYWGKWRSGIYWPGMSQQH